MNGKTGRRGCRGENKTGQDGAAQKTPKNTLPKKLQTWPLTVHMRSANLVDLFREEGRETGCNHDEDVCT
ncbi:MAG TPA: hypothetical protein P5527_10610, partial [Kiritimatiellia bacterium]|nr:hypothetical protein [Kiritimatiellia bacterium]